MQPRVRGHEREPDGDHGDDRQHAPHAPPYHDHATLAAVRLDAERARRLARRLALPAAVVAVAAAYVDTLRQGFVADARFLLADNRYLDGWSAWRATLTHDYFWSSSGALIPYWRPLTKLSWLVEAQAFGRGSALGFHAVQLGLDRPRGRGRRRAGAAARRDAGVGGAGGAGVRAAPGAGRGRRAC